MHTSSAVDATDEFLEIRGEEGRHLLLQARQRGAAVRDVHDHGAVQDRDRDGREKVHRLLLAAWTGDRAANGKWVTFALMNEPVKALTQSYTRTKAKDYKAFKQTMELHTNSSNNTLFADASGQHRVLPRQLHSAARHVVRLDQTGGRQQSGDRLEGPAFGGRIAEPAEPRQRLALQLQQLAVVGRRSQQPEAGGLSEVRRQRQRVGARPPRDPGAGEQEGLHARRACATRRSTATRPGSRSRSPR